ncbi:MAG: hypothetical protein GW859_10940 [Sphingomonadales bacterium]|nr:hypothetical protein [Sphingomonadales bacterium]
MKPTYASSRAGALGLARETPPQRAADPIDEAALATVRRILIQAGDLALARSYVPVSRRFPVPGER